MRIPTIILLLMSLYFYSSKQPEAGMGFLVLAVLYQMGWWFMREPRRRSRGRLPWQRGKGGQDADRKRKTGSSGERGVGKKGTDRESRDMKKIRKIREIKRTMEIRRTTVSRKKGKR